MARATGNLGKVLAQLNQHAQAIPLLLTASQTFGQIGDPHEHATHLADLAESYLALGQRDRARRRVGEAYQIFAAHDDVWRIANLKERFGDLMPLNRA